LLSQKESALSERRGQEEISGNCEKSAKARRKGREFGNRGSDSSMRRLLKKLFGREERKDILLTCLEKETRTLGNFLPPASLGKEGPWSKAAGRGMKKGGEGRYGCCWKKKKKGSGKGRGEKRCNALPTTIRDAGLYRGREVLKRSCRGREAIGWGGGEEAALWCPEG